jgi:hypothetical protein
MIKLLSIVLLIVPLFGEKTRFIFPDHHSRFLSFAERSMKKSSHIVLISASLEHTALKKTLQSAAKSGSEIKLYLSTAGKGPLSLIQYRGIDLFLTPVRMEHTYLLIDEEIVCTTTGGIDEERFSESAPSMHCSSDPADLLTLKPSIKEIMRRSTPYLQE